MNRAVFLLIFLVANRSAFADELDKREVCLRQLESLMTGEREIWVAERDAPPPADPVYRRLALQTLENAKRYQAQLKVEFISSCLLVR